MIHEPIRKEIIIKFIFFSTLKLEESTSTLEILPGPSTLEIEIQKCVHANTRLWTLPAFPSSRGLKRRAFSKALGLLNVGKVLSLVFELLNFLTAWAQILRRAEYRSNYIAKIGFTSA